MVTQRRLCIMHFSAFKNENQLKFQPNKTQSETNEVLKRIHRRNYDIVR